MAVTTNPNVLKALNNVEQSVLPRQSSERIQQMDNARTIQLQSELGGGATGTAPSLTAASAANAVSQITKAQGVQIVGETQKLANQTAQVEEQRQKQNLFTQQQKLTEKATAIRKKQSELQQSLSSFDSRTKAEIFDSNMQFQRDELGRTQFNEQQLADYAVSKVRTAEEFANYEQMSQQISERKMYILKAAQARIQQELSQSFAGEQQELDQSLQLELTQRAQALKEKLLKEQNAAKNRASIWTAAGTIVGAVVGTIGSGGNPIGAVAGASIGGGIGSIAAGSTN